MNYAIMIGQDPAHPLNRIEWRAADTLRANHYNPNMVFTPELKLLERSLIQTGWLQPLLILPDGTIIDGFHRHMLAKESKELLARDLGYVPCAVLTVTPATAMAITVRINRAKGSHAAVKMHELVRELVDQHGWTREQVGQEIGAPRQEVDLLYQEGVFAQKNIKDYKYSRAWVPGEAGTVRKNQPDRGEPR